MKIYISGKITGLPFDEVAEKFNEAERCLAAKGFEVLSPLKTGMPCGLPWESYIAIDIILLMGCDAVYFLPDWIHSKGATIENTIAELTGKQIIYQKVPVFVHLKQAIYEVMGVLFHEIAGDNRERKNVYARMIYAHFCSEQGATITNIAAEMSRDHSTVIYYLRKFEDEIKFNSFFREIVNRIGIAQKTLKTPQISN
jgi:hypothetical protein